MTIVEIATESQANRMIDSDRPLDALHFLTIAVLVMLEFLQNGMVSFSSSFISGGIGAAPEEFSLAAASYAGVAVIMIFQHGWLVRKLGYRRFLQIALIFFAIGAFVCANADDPDQFVAGRVIQALGGSAFFTAARVQVMHYKVNERAHAFLAFGIGLLSGAGMAAFCAAFLIEHASWRAVFDAMIPLSAACFILVELSIPTHSPSAGISVARHHLGGFAALVCGVFALQFLLGRTPYDFFSNGVPLAWAFVLAAIGIVVFVRHDIGRSQPFVFQQSLAQGRYMSGLFAYFTCYVIAGLGAFILPIFLVSGLGFAVQSIGGILSLSSLTGVGVMVMLSTMLPKWPSLKKYFLIALTLLFGYGWWMSKISEDTSLNQLIIPLIVHNGIFLTVAQLAAAFGTFRDVDEAVFPHAYQIKNALREVAGATGISIATVLLQARSTFHYARLMESADPLHQLVNASQSALQQFANQVSREATLMACQDYFVALCFIAVVAAIAVALQRKLT